MKVVTADEFEKEALKEMEYLLQEDLNIKVVVPVADSSTLIRYVARPNFRELGKGPLKGMIPQIKAHLESVDGNEVKCQIDDGGYEFKLDEKPVTLKPEEVDLQAVASDEFAVQSEGRLSIALNKVLSRDLLLEGLARELVNKIQFMRKEGGFDIVDRIRVNYDVSDGEGRKDIEDSINSYGAYIGQETLARSIKGAENASDATEWNINGIKVKLSISKEASV
jgi:isoleucyl-tRNA synthetase